MTLIFCVLQGTTMCRLCERMKAIFRNVSQFKIFILCFICLSSGVNSQFNFNLQNTIQSARHNNCSSCKRILDLSIAEKRRLDIIMKRIINKLEIEPKTKNGHEARIKPRDSVYLQQKHTYPEMSEIVSFPEKPGTFI